MRKTTLKEFYLSIEYKLLNLIICLNKMKSKIAKVLIVLLSLIVIPNTLHAQEETQKSTKPLEELISLELPSITDNPSLIINFTDPSKEKEGMQLSIDKKGFETIQSPHTLPALSIGDHLLTFKFKDEYDVTQTIDKELIVIPRAPVINTPLITGNEITFSGSALAGAEVTLILTSNQKMITKKAEVDNDGKWEIKMNEEIPSGFYTFSAIAKKYGYASELAEFLTLEINDSKDTIRTTENGITPIHFAFKDLNQENLKSLTHENLDLLVLFIGLLLIGMLVGIFLTSLSKKKQEEKEVKEVAKTLDKPVEDINRPLTLLEKLKDKTVNIDNPIKEEKTEEIVEEKKEEETPKDTIAKIDFLKNFKKHDPDDEKGREKEDVKVSLTTKK